MSNEITITVRQNENGEWTTSQTVVMDDISVRDIGVGFGLVAATVKRISADFKNSVASVSEGNEKERILQYTRGFIIGFTGKIETIEETTRTEVRS